MGVSGATQTLSTTGVVTALTETAPPGYVLAGVTCTGMGPGGTAITLSSLPSAPGAVLQLKADTGSGGGATLNLPVLAAEGQYASIKPAESGS